MGCMHQLQPNAMIDMIYVHEINQVSIFVRSEQRCVALDELFTGISPHPQGHYPGGDAVHCVQVLAVQTL